MSADLAGLDFSGAMRDAKKGMILKPILGNYLFDASFPAHTVRFPKEDMERKPDGWFHPSEHPLWTERALYAYLAHPHQMVIEKKDYMGSLSVTVGKAMHSFIQMCLTDAKVMPKGLQKCTVCPPTAKCKEPGVIDREAGTRGHMDGVLDLSALSVPQEAERSVFEFKTTNDRKLSKVDDLDLDKYREVFPHYYAQNQEYLRMSGLRFLVVFFLAMGYPWQMKEIHVPYDPTYALKIRDKYLRVRQAVADQAPARDCCGLAKGCPARGTCTVLNAAPTAEIRLLRAL